MKNFMKKISNHLNLQYILFSLAIVALLQTSVAFSFNKIENIALSKLGGFETRFSTIEKVDFIDGQNVIGEVDIKAGENYSVHFPFNIQRIHYHIKNGSLIKKGDTVASVEGYEVDHFIEEYALAQQLLAVSENNFKANRQYFENNIITSSQWVEITKTYFAAKLNFEHLHHQMAFLHIDENEQVTLISPKAGIIKTTSFSTSIRQGELAFDVIDPNTIQVKVSLPILTISSLSHLKVSPDCLLTINSLEHIVNKYHQTLWASPKKNTDCNLTLGQVITVTPIQKFKGYKIDKSAVFEFEDKNYIAIEAENALAMITINLFGSKNNAYYFTANKDLEGKKGLISSVSILQGYLLNLGTE